MSHDSSICVKRNKELHPVMNITNPVCLTDFLCAFQKNNGGMWLKLITGLVTFITGCSSLLKQIRVNSIQVILSIIMTQSGKID